MKKAKKMIEEYTSDINALKFKFVPFSIREGMDDCIEYPKQKSNCGCPVSFQMRALIATFGDDDPKRTCLKVRFPIALPDPGIISAQVALLKDCGAICVDLDGEEWGIVPQSLTDASKYTPTYDYIPLIISAFSPKLSGRMKDYVSDALPTTFRPRPKVAIEVDPIGFANDVAVGTVNIDSGTGLPTANGNEDGCTGPLNNQIICLISDIRARYLTVFGNSVKVGGTGADEPPAIFRRKVPINTLAKVASCIKKAGNYTGIHCVGYKGESITRIDLLV
jgi:hypothetical protein